ncbi:hypothetical protein [Trichocoleus sp. DQ-U1]
MERSHPLQHAAQTADAIAADKAPQTKRYRQSAADKAMTDYAILF